jgi:hypothetical protein
VLPVLDAGITYRVGARPRARGRAAHVARPAYVQVMLHQQGGGDCVRDAVASDRSRTTESYGCREVLAESALMVSGRLQ